MSKKKNLVRKLAGLGFPLFETEEPLDVNEIFVEVVKSKEIRFWEGFPILLANGNEEGTFDFSKVENMLNDKKDRANFFNLVLISLSLYENFGLKFLWSEELKKQFSSKEKGKLKNFSEKIKKNKTIKISEYNLSSDRIKKMFNNYFLEEGRKGDKILEDRYERFSLEYALSQIFPKKQKELFIKKLNGDKLTKTEQEYYSRVVKKKVISLANQKLHQLARRLLER